MLNVAASVVAFTTDRMVGIFGPITCSGYDWLVEVLQYTEYPVMIPFLGMGRDQLAERAVGDPGTGDSVKLGEDGTEKMSAVKSVFIYCIGKISILGITFSLVNLIP